MKAYFPKLNGKRLKYLSKNETDSGDGIDGRSYKFSIAFFRCTQIDGRGSEVASN